ncbi:ubiquitin-protein transferase [Aureococcus anophagefferens]|nr:ubiquitin-protein transferase [Aureococcus anophagefferens]
MGYAEAMAKIGMRMTKTNLARAEANPKVTITTPKAEPKADDGAAAAPRPTASSPGPKAPSTPSVVGKLLRGADRVGRASTAQAVREFHLKKEMMDFAEDQCALAETHGDQRGKAQRLSRRRADDKLEALLQLSDVASDAKLLRGEHVAEHQRALTTASGVELLPHRFCFSEEPPLANEMHIVTPGVGEWYAIRLLRRPSHPVRVNMASRSDSILIEPPSVAFAGDGWAEPKHVYARPSWDELRVATHVVRIWHYVVSDDATFHNARVPPLPVHCYKTASPNVLTFGNDDDGQLGSLNRIYPKLDDYNQIELPHELSRAFLDAHRAALDGLDEQDRAKAGVRDYTRHAHHRAHAEGIAADGGASPTSPSKDAAGGLTLSRKQARAMRRAFQELDPDSTNAAYISSDSDVPPDGPAFRRYVAVRLGHRHDEKHATRQGDGHKVLDMAAGGSHSVLACYDGNVCGANGEASSASATSSRASCRRSSSSRATRTSTRALYQSIAKHHDRLFTERVVVVAVACGWRHSAISTNGACFVWGENSNGKLGLGRDVPRAERPTRVLGGVLDGVLVLHVACGTGTRSAAAWTTTTRGASALAWGHRINGALGVPTTFRTDGATRTEAHDMSDLLACGTFHSAFVDGDGRLLTCGLGDSGQLGRDLRRVAADPVDGTPNRARADARAFTFGPVLLPRRSRLGAARLRCLRVACGGNHTVLLSSSHEVFSFGKGSSGQLGTAELEHRAAPARLDALLDKGVIGIAAGASFSAAWTESGHTYVWGEATAGQLGHAKEHHTSSNVMPLPNLVPILSYARCRSLAFGGSHTLALTEHDTVTVKRMVSNSRAFFNDFRGHARLHRHVAAERKLRDAQRDTRHRDRAARRTWRSPAPRRRGPTTPRRGRGGRSSAPGGDSELLGYVETLLWDRKWARRGRASPGTGDASPASPASPRTGNNRTTYRPRLSLGPKPARAPRGGPAAPATQESRLRAAAAGAPPPGDDGAAEAVDCAYEAFHVAAAPKRRPDSAPPGGKRRPGSAPRKAEVRAAQGARALGRRGRAQARPPPGGSAAARPRGPSQRRRPPPAEAPARDADGLAGDGGAAFDAAAGAFVAPVGAAAAFVEVPPGAGAAAERQRQRGARRATPTSTRARP